MFDHFKKLLADGFSKRHSRRPPRKPRLRGQIEPLESRTVLSATMGPMMAVQFVAVDVEAETITVVTVWESRPAPAATFAIQSLDQSFHQFGDAPWENRAAFVHAAGPGRGPGTTGGYVKPPQAIKGGSSQGDLNATGVVGEIVDFENRNNNSHPGNVALGATFNDNLANETVATGNSATNTSVGPRDDGRYQMRQRFDSYSAANYYSSLPTANISTAISASTTNSSLKLQRNELDASSPDDLLLAASVDSDRELDDDLADKLDSPDKESDVDADSHDAEVGSDIVASLDALRRERAAVDAVLAELHEVSLQRDEHHADSTSDPSRQRDDRDSFDQEVFATTARWTPEPARHEADGGMVLLTPSGDANSSAYDLAAVYFTRLGRDEINPLGVEATVGMYQAIDIGTSDLRPASRENLPLAQPASTTQPSVSAENAPAKKSEQPS
jgi:hypothetical protein